nr:MerR family transcriptional regulator [Kibdelosporangium sp. MJ126-NF4]CTQ92909.1 transcriptional regulator [Kibdelosporangium sp. MJ126-NF4]
MTAKKFAAEIGRTARTLRSYHARGLLPPPVRMGRTPCYSDEHLTRMRQVLQLQRHGLPLEAIRALLEPDLVLGELLPLRRAVAIAVRDQPALRDSLVASGILTRRPDGGLDLHGIRALLAARVVTGLPTCQVLGLAANSVNELMPHAHAALTQVRRTVTSEVSDGEIHVDAVRDLAVEVIRICLRQLTSE